MKEKKTNEVLQAIGTSSIITSDQNEKGQALASSTIAPSHNDCVERT